MPGHMIDATFFENTAVFLRDRATKENPCRLW